MFSASLPTSTALLSRRLTARRDELLARCAALEQKAADREKALQEKLAFANLQQDAQELQDWIAEKRITATDQSYRDLTNLPTKLQKHEAFESEVQANRPVLEDLIEVSLQN